MKKLLTILLTVLLAVTTITFNVAADPVDEEEIVENISEGEEIPNVGNPEETVVPTEEKNDSNDELNENELSNEVDEVIESVEDNAKYTFTLDLGYEVDGKEIIVLGKTATAWPSGKAMALEPDYPVREGYYFVGWLNKKDNTEFIFRHYSSWYGVNFSYIDENTTIIAQWVEKPLLTVYRDDTTDPEVVEAKHGYNGDYEDVFYVTKPIGCEKENYLLSHWADKDGNEVKFDDEVYTYEYIEDIGFDFVPVDNALILNGNTELHAVWEQYILAKNIVPGKKYIIVEPKNGLAYVAENASESISAKITVNDNGFLQGEGETTYKDSTFVAESDADGNYYLKKASNGKYLYRGTVFEKDYIELGDNGTKVKIDDKNHFQMYYDYEGYYCPVVKGDFWYVYTGFITELSGDYTYLYEKVESVSYNIASDLVYDAKVKHPITVTVDKTSKKLFEGKDFTVEYTKGDETTNYIVNAGDYDVVIKLNPDSEYYFNGNQKEIKGKVSVAKAQAIAKLDKKDGKYGLNDPLPVVTVLFNDGKRILYPKDRLGNDNYSVTIMNGTDVVTSLDEIGDYVAVVELLNDANNNLYFGSKDEQSSSILLEFEVVDNREVIQAPELVGTYTYNGKDQMPFFKYDRKKVVMLFEESEWVKKDAGTYTVKFKLVNPTKTEWAYGLDEDGDGVIEVKWTINKKVYSYDDVLKLVNKNLTYNGKAQEPIKDLNKKLPGVEFVDAYGYTHKEKNVPNSKYYALVRLTDNNNYAWSEDTLKYHNWDWAWMFGDRIEIPWTINKAKATVVISHEPITYGDKLPVKYDLSSKDFYEKDFDKIKEYIKVNVPSSSDAGEYPLDAKIVIPDFPPFVYDDIRLVNNNYDIKFVGTLTIKKAKLTASLLLPEEGYVYDGTKKEPGVKLDGYKYTDEGLPFVVEYNVGLLENSVDAGDKYARVALGNKLAKNYYLEGENLLGYVYLPYVIARKPVNVTWDQTLFTYNGKVQEPKASTKDFVRGDLVTLLAVNTHDGAPTPKLDELTDEANALGVRPIDAGKYYQYVILFGLDAHNYKLVDAKHFLVDYVGTKFSIQKRTLHLTWDNVTSFVYDGKEHAPFITKVTAIVDGEEVEEGIIKKDLEEYVKIDYVEGKGKKVNVSDKYVAEVELVPGFKGDKTKNYVILPEDTTKAFKIYKVVPHKDPVKTGVDE